MKLCGLKEGKGSIHYSIFSDLNLIQSTCWSFFWVLAPCGNGLFKVFRKNVLYPTSDFTFYLSLRRTFWYM